MIRHRPGCVASPKEPIMTHQHLSFCAMAAAVILQAAGCTAQVPVPKNLSPGVVIQQEGMADLQKSLAEKITAAPQKIMDQPGLAAAMGGVKVKLLKSGESEILLPLPQLTAGQVPVCYAIRSTPEDAATEYRLRTRDDNQVVTVRVKGNRNDEVQLEWSAVVLLAGSKDAPLPKNIEDYRAASGCVQAQSDEIVKIAGDLWPEDKNLPTYAANIQKHVREMKQQKPPRSLDALGILSSGANGICTANANLASALLRSKGVASRSVAVIPTNSMRLEMHRIVEYADGDQWAAFDPSSVHADCPMKPYQSVIMATTTIDDEAIAMKPRMGAMVGCPYAQELELLDNGATLFGQDFFWTLAKPLAEFEPDEEAVELATKAWQTYLETGTQSAGQIAVGGAGTLEEFKQGLKSE
jgi:hypothetical protein